MPKGNKLLQTVEAVYAAGLDEDLWPSALSSVTKLVGGVGTTLEAVDKTSLQLTDFWAHGVPPGSELEYAAHYITISPRVVFGYRGCAGDIGYDYLVLDEAAIDRDAYYMEFLRSGGLRYFISGTLTLTERNFACFAVQRSARQGHIGRRDIGLMETLTPHVQQAFDITQRLRSAGRTSHGVDHALDWIADGAALVRADGTMLYINRSLQAIARAGDGIRIAKNRLELGSADAAGRVARAVASACSLHDGEVESGKSSDFPVERPSGAPPYLISVRPLVGASRQVRTRPDADAILFVRDPSQQDTSTVELLRELFGLTEAEAHLARALQSGTPLAEYTRARGLSLNTVYTHLRRVKEKIGCRRQSELIRKLGEIRLGARGE